MPDQLNCVVVKLLALQSDGAQFGSRLGQIKKSWALNGNATEAVWFLKSYWLKLVQVEKEGTLFRVWIR